MGDTERLHIELFSHLTGLAAFHQSALHVLQPGGREGGKRNREGERTETEMFESCRSCLNTEHLGQFRSKTWGGCVKL